MDTRIKFNHSAETVSETLSIPSDRSKFIFTETIVAYARSDNYGRAIEMAIDLIKPQNAAELVYIGLLLGKK